MIDIFDRIRPDYCPICNEDRVVELYDIFGNALNISYLFDNNRLYKLDNKYIYDMQCTKCKTSFVPIWNTNDYPVAMKKSDEVTLQQFLTDFKNG